MLVRNSKKVGVRNPGALSDSCVLLLGSFETLNNIENIFVCGENLLTRNLF